MIITLAAHSSSVAAALTDTHAALQWSTGYHGDSGMLFCTSKFWNTMLSVMTQSSVDCLATYSITIDVFLFELPLLLIREMTESLHMHQAVCAMLLVKLHPSKFHPYCNVISITD